MKGLVFTGFLEIVEQEFSPAVVERIIELSDLPSGGAYTTLGTYSHSEILTLATHLSKETDIPVPALVHTFGRHLFGQLVDTHPWAVQGVNSTFEFLEKVHGYIHVEVLKLYPDAELPRFSYDTSESGQLIMRYQSSRPFADLAEGMIESCIAYYGENISLQREDVEGAGGKAARFILVQEAGEVTPAGITPQSTPTPTPQQSDSEEATLLRKKLARERNARQQAEQLAEEKTRELYLANEKITSLNDLLKEENVRMSAELDVTRQLQRMLLPSDDELASIPGLDISAYMEPADEVGGDYYDVLRYNDRVKIGIGDVTGHGLESGVVMLMTQMGTRVLLASDETNATRFLGILNRAVFDNVQRMDVDKSLTLTLLDYIPAESEGGPGRVQVSGQHEDLIIVRKDGSIELIDTFDLGFPIGLDDDITDFVGEYVVQLRPGDGIVLYTDGITEAENLAHEYYGLEKLCEVISANWTHSAEGIKDAIIKDVYQHIGQQKLFDDITMVVLKQK